MHQFVGAIARERTNNKFYNLRITISYTKHMDAIELRKKKIEVEINHIASMAHKALQSSKICH